MMTGDRTTNATSTWAIALTSVAGVATLLGFVGHVAVLLLLGILLSVAGLVLGIVARREAAITISAVALLVGLAVGFGLISY